MFEIKKVYELEEIQKLQKKQFRLEKNNQTPPPKIKIK